MSILLSRKALVMAAFLVFATLLAGLVPVSPASAASSPLNSLNIKNAGSKMIPVCEDWALPAGTNTHPLQCPAGSRIGVLKPGQTTRNQMGWKDTDGVCAQAGHNVKVRTIAGVWKTVVTAGSKRLCAKISPSLLTGVTTSGWIANVKMEANSSSGGGGSW